MATIYANPSPRKRKLAMGYVEYFELRHIPVAKSMLQKKTEEELFKKILIRLHKERWHFSQRIKQTHKHSIPLNVIYMKLRKFIREVADKVIKENSLQLEFDFD